MFAYSLCQQHGIKTCTNASAQQVEVKLLKSCKMPVVQVGHVTSVCATEDAAA